MPLAEEEKSFLSPRSSSRYPLAHCLSYFPEMLDSTPTCVCGHAIYAFGEFSLGLKGCELGVCRSGSGREKKSRISAVYIRAQMDGKSPHTHTQRDILIFYFPRDVIPIRPWPHIFDPLLFSTEKPASAVNLLALAAGLFFVASADKFRRKQLRGAEEEQRREKKWPLRGTA